MATATVKFVNAPSNKPVKSKPSDTVQVNEIVFAQLPDTHQKRAGFIGYHSFVGVTVDLGNGLTGKIDTVYKKL